jgi:hypothetical protein
MVVPAFQTNSEHSLGTEIPRPMDIARNRAFTSREKIEMLSQLRADVTGAEHEGVDLGVTTAEIDEAIEEIRREAEAGLTGGTETLGGAK